MTDIIITKRTFLGIIIGALIAVILLGSSILVAALFYAGGQNIVMGAGSSITNLSTTTNDTDAANKAYVDKRRPYYEGLTTSTSTAAMGGLDGANGLCNAVYPGSHLCTQGEIVSAGTRSVSDSGWVACDGYHGSAGGGTSGICVGTVHAVDNTATGYEDICATYNSASSSSNGIVMGTNGKLSAVACNSNYKLHCCS